MKLKYLMPVAISSMLALSNFAFAVTADDVVCAGCINGADISSNAVSTTKIKFAAITTDKIKGGAVTKAKIAGSAVTSGKIAAGAVTSDKIADDSVTTVKIVNSSITTSKIVGSAITSGKIANGAVSEAKLSAAVQTKLNTTGGGGVTTYDIPTVTATKRVYQVIGNMTCNAGTVDKEVHLISRSILGNGVKRTVLTRKRSFNGSVCNYSKFYFNFNGNQRTLYKKEIYDISGTTLLSTREFINEGGASCASDFEGCGLTTVPNGVAEGQIQVTAGIVSEDTTSETDLAISSTSFQGVDSQTINEGEATEETFNSCNGYIEDRTSTFFGTSRIFREICPSVGAVTIYLRRVTSSSPTGAVWMIASLTSYTL